MFIQNTLWSFYNWEINSISANPTKWSSALKRFVGKFPTNCLSVFDHFDRFGLVRKVFTQNIAKLRLNFQRKTCFLPFKVPDNWQSVLFFWFCSGFLFRCHCNNGKVIHKLYFVNENLQKPEFFGWLYCESLHNFCSTWYSKNF